MSVFENLHPYNDPTAILSRRDIKERDQRIWPRSFIISERYQYEIWVKGGGVAVWERRSR